MLELLLVLTSLALIDSLSILPMALLPLILLLGGQRPLAGSLAFIAGISLSYLPFGLLLLFGLDSLFDSLGSKLVAWWRKEPDVGELVLEVAIGALMLAFGYKLANKRGRKAAQKADAGMYPLQAFILAVLINLSGMWGALPYFAAIAHILRHDLSPTGMSASLLYYNLVFVLPLLGMLLLRLLAGAGATPWLEKINAFILHWGGSILATLLIMVGLLLIIDGSSWLLGIPVFDFSLPESGLVTLA